MCAAWHEVREVAPAYRPRRHLFLSELDGPDYDRAVDAADQLVADRERGLYGDRDHDQRVGWFKEDL